MAKAPRNFGIGGGAVALVVVVVHALSGASHSLADITLSTAKNAHDVTGVLRSLDDGTYVKKQATGFFCSAVASLVTTDRLPGQATSFRSYVAARTGTGTTGVEQYLGGKLQQLEAAADLAQQNPTLARRYWEGCRPFGF